MVMSVVEQQVLSNVATILRNNLISQISGPIEFETNIRLQEDDHIDGWWATIATFGDPAIDIAVWLDTYARHDHRCFWIGFFSERKRSIGILRRLLGKVPSTFSYDHISLNSKEQYSRMKVALQDSLFGQPVGENYPGVGYFLGIYYPDNPTDTENLNSNIVHSTKWLMSILGPLPDFSCEEGADHYSATENRLIVSFHLRRERDPTLARLCKERDGYRCQVCEIRLDEVYGDVAESFAEAHHIVPLNKIDGPVDQDVSHLKTVCANCHRMLHRLHGKESDLADLRLRYSRAKKNYEPIS